MENPVPEWADSMTIAKEVIDAQEVRCPSLAPDMKAAADALQKLIEQVSEQYCYEEKHKKDISFILWQVLEGYTWPIFPREILYLLRMRAKQCGGWIQDGNWIPMKDWLAMYQIWDDAS